MSSSAGDRTILPYGDEVAAKAAVDAPAILSGSSLKAAVVKADDDAPDGIGDENQHATDGSGTVAPLVNGQ